jgi:hypothetical protein
MARLAILLSLLAPFAVPATASAAPTPMFFDDFSTGLTKWRYVGTAQSWTAASDAEESWVQVDNLSATSGSYLTPDPPATLGDNYEYSIQLRTDAVGTGGTVSMVAELPVGAATITEGGMAIQILGAGRVRVQSPIQHAVCSGDAPVNLGELVTVTGQKWGSLLRFLVNGQQVAVLSAPVGGGTPAFGAYRATARVYSASVTALQEAPSNFPSSATGCSWSPTEPAQAQPVLVNQSGYDLEGAKRFSAPLAEDGAAFDVLNPDDQTVVSGTVQAGVGDFSNFAPDVEGPYRVRVIGNAGTGTSYPFGVGPSWTTRVATTKALKFLAGSMCHNGDFAAAAANPPQSNTQGATWCQKGVAWRDASQYAYELTVLADLLSSNPSVILQIPGDPTLLTGMPHALPAEAPLVAQLLYWGAEVYLLHQVNEPQLKAQLASFARVYPLVEEWIPRDTYDRAVQYLRSQWAEPARDRFVWEAYTPYDGNLLQVYTQVGTGKGELVPGFSIIANLDLHAVAIREGWPEAQTYLDAAAAQATWIASNLDIADPATTKGQRMSEWLTVTGMVKLSVQYPTAVPGAVDFVSRWADVALSRADNMWDFRKYDDSGTTTDRWTIPPFTGGASGDPNEVGNTAGFAAPALAAALLLGPDDPRSGRLAQLAASHVDNLFGRNPVNRAAQYRVQDPMLAYEGLDRGWFSEYQGGAGLLQGLPGVLDGGPKNGHYPYSPNVGNIGHTEGWVNFNTAFVEALAWIGNARTSVTIAGQAGTTPVAGEPLMITARGPFDLEQRTDVVPAVQVTAGKAAPISLPLTRSGAGNWTAELTTAPDQSGQTVTARLGADVFAVSAAVTLMPASPTPDAPPGKPVLQDDNGWDTGLRDADYTLTATLWWGVPGDSIRIFEGDNLVFTQPLGSQTMPQRATFHVTGKANGTYSYRVELVNSRGATSSDTHTVTVTDASPTTPVLSADNWDGDGSYRVTANLWWGTNATRWTLNEDGLEVASGVLLAATPQPQRVDVPFVDRSVGTHTYTMVFANGQGESRSAPLDVHVRE